MIYDYPQMMELRFPTNELVRNTQDVMSRTFVPMVVFNRTRTITSLVKAKKTLEKMSV
jgi:hypothetical protein